VTFIYQRDPERLLRHFIGNDEDEVVLQSLAWSEQKNAELVSLELPARV
jgi:hypothetical protein